MTRRFLRGCDFLSLSPVSGEELLFMVEEALRLKNEGTKGFHPLSGKVIALLFEKPSTRTRVSFEVAVLRLGGYPMFLSSSELQIGRGETLEDTARVLSRYVDGLVVRTFAQSRLEELAQAASIPVINALTDECHPCQALADMLTIYENKGVLEGLKLTYLGDGNNVANSLMRAGTKLGMEVFIATPEGKSPYARIVEECKVYCDISGAKLILTSDPSEAAKDADILYTDVWVSMGSEDEISQIEEIFIPFQLNENVLELAKSDAIVMHCLPAHRGLEITDEVIDGNHSVVWEQAENRLHAQIALLAMIYG